MTDDTAGDPVSALKWTRKSTRKASDELKTQNISMCSRTVARLLKRLNFSLKANRKSIAQTCHPDRDQQFHYIHEMRAHYKNLGEPIISVDSKKKELIGNFYNSGRAWCHEAEEVNDHDFRSAADAIATPYGIFDPVENKGFVVVGQSSDTPEFAVDNIVHWIENRASTYSPEIKRLLILCDCGGSNGYRPRAWKYFIQKRLCDVFKIAVTVCHYPAGASKWNPIEHRMFSFISINWAGKPLPSIEVMLKFICHTKTKTGLKIQAILNKKNTPRASKSVMLKWLKSISVNIQPYHTGIIQLLQMSHNKIRK